MSDTVGKTQVEVQAYIEFKDAGGKTLWQKITYNTPLIVATRLKRQLEIIQATTPFIRKHYVNIHYSPMRPLFKLSSKKLV